VPGHSGRDRKRRLERLPRRGSHTHPTRKRALPQITCGLVEAPSLARRVSMIDNSDERDESGRLLTRRVDIGEQSRKKNEDRKNDPIPVRCTSVYRSLKNAEIVRQNPALRRARNALQAAKREPHIVSSQAHPIRRVYIRANSKNPPDYPLCTSGDNFRLMFTYLKRGRSQHFISPRERAGQPGPRAENREWGQDVLPTRSPKHHGQSEIERRARQQ